MTKEEISHRERELLIMLMLDFNIDVLATEVSCRFCSDWTYTGFVNEHVAEHASKHLRETHNISFESE